MTFSEFSIDSAVLEIRYEKSYWMWDRSGLLWAELKSRLPSLTVVEASPAKIVLVDGSRVELKIEHGLASVIDRTPDHDLESLVSAASVLHRVVPDVLEIDAFTRLGFRTVWLKEFDDRLVATSEFLSSPRLRLIEPPHFGVHGHLIDPVFEIRIEGDRLGVKFIARVQEQSISLGLLGEAQKFFPDIAPKKRAGIFLDIDQYQTTLVEPPLLDAQEWISQNMRLLRRDADTFLSGKS